MPIVLTKKFTFEAAHWLPFFPEGHKCRRLHGHSFRVEIQVKGESNAEGILLDFGVVKAIVKPYIDLLDHRCINEVGDERQDELLKNPTSENLSKWFYDQLKPELPDLDSVLIHETCTSSCLYYK